MVPSKTASILVLVALFGCAQAPPAEVRGPIQDTTRPRQAPKPPAPPAKVQDRLNEIDATLKRLGETIDKRGQ